MSRVQRSGLYAAFDGPVRKRLCFAVPLNSYGVAFVVALLFHGGPSAIFRRVSGIIVFAINRMLGRWARAHVSVEIHEQQPSVAYGNTATLVVFEVFRLRILATVDQPGPYVVFRTSSHAMRRLCRTVPQGKLLPSDAAAGLRFTARYVCGPRGLFPAAIACAHPHRAALLSVKRSALYYRQKAEALACDIDWFGHMHTLVRGATPAGFLFSEVPA